MLQLPKHAWHLKSFHTKNAVASEVLNSKCFLKLPYWKGFVFRMDEFHFKALKQLARNLAMKKDASLDQVQIMNKDVFGLHFNWTSIYTGQQNL